MDKITEQEIYGRFQNRNSDFALYVHIPFCSGKCTFCYFCQIEQPTGETITDYTDALKKEIELTGKKITDQLGRGNVKSIFFGGGSPTVLSNVQFEDLIASIKQQFSVPDDIEITMEIHPEIMRCNNRSLLECYFANNVNRLNIGIQSFDDTILQSTNRRHLAQEGMEVFGSAREIGFHNINIDLLYPLPDLTPEIWEKTLDAAFDLEPESITTYFTTIRKPSSMYNLLHEHPERFPDEYTNHLFRIMAIEKAKERGYDHTKLIDWFVKPNDGFHYNHQKNEVRRTEEIQLLSFGSGVFTYLNHVQFYNYPDIHTYCEMLRKNTLPVWRGIKLTDDERLARAMVLGIKSGEVNIDEIEKRFAVNVRQKYHQLLLKLEELGLLEITASDIRLSYKGILFADEVAVQFITENIRNKLSENKDTSEAERDLIESYNFLYDINGLNFL
jgi:oxygen-independent coproporphyrinogen-3 oxidase